MLVTGNFTHKSSLKYKNTKIVDERIYDTHYNKGL